MKKIFYFAIVLLIVIFVIPQIFAGYSWQEAEISRVLNSNTFITKGGGKSRIIGVLPNDEFSSDKRAVCHAKTNSREIKNLLLNNKILTAEDEKVRDTKHLKIDKEYVTEIILRNGWAKMSDDEVSSYFSARFKKAQDYAKNKQLGLWALCPNDLNWSKIRGNFGERMRKFKKENTVFLGKVAVGKVEEVLSGNSFRFKNGPIINLQNVEIPRENNQANACFRENSRNFLENLILGKQVRIEKEFNGVDIDDFGLVRNVFLTESSFKLRKTAHGSKSREISVNEKIIADGFGKFPRNTTSSNLGEFELEKVQQEVYANPRGAWRICARDILNTDFSAKKEEIREIDESCPIKGNISGTKKSPIKTYHTVLSGWYDRIQAEQCFQTEDEANFAGFRKIK